MSRCNYCGRSLSLVPDDEIETERESTGFGAANNRRRVFCSTRCRCLWLDVDRVLETTQQTQLTAFVDDAGPADRIAWSVQ